MNKQVTSLEQFRMMSMGEIISISPFIGEEYVNIRVKKPSMMKMLSDGRIPNTLLATAQDMFNLGSKKSKKSKDDDGLSAITDVIQIADIIAQECMVEPTYDEIASFGLELTEQQLMEIFTYAQGGVKLLENFRKEQTNSNGNQPS